MVNEKSITDLVGYLKELRQKKLSYLIPLNSLAKLMKAVDFDGPNNERGAVRSFSHPLLKNQRHLINGQFTVHEAHNKKGQIFCRDYKDYMRPHIIDVLIELRNQGLHQEDISDV